MREMTEAAAVLLPMLQALLLTVLFETAAALALGVRKRQDILTVILINCITNPIINFAMLLVVFLFPYDSHRLLYYSLLVVFELAVVFWEYSFYKKRFTYDKINLLLFSLILNAISVTLGFVLQPVIRLIHSA